MQWLNFSPWYSNIALHCGVIMPQCLCKGNDKYEVCVKHYLLIQVTFNISLDPPMPPWLLDLDTLIKDIRGEELAPNFTIRADVNFVDLHSFVEGPKFWKTFPLKQGQMPEMLLHPKSYLQYNTTNLNTENKYFCNIVMVGHFTFGLC